MTNRKNFALRVTALPLIALAFSLSPAAMAQDITTVSIGRIQTTQTCQYFQESEFSSGLVASPWFLASQTYWRTWWVKDCMDNFPTFQTTLEAALASSGHIRVGRGQYKVNVSLSSIGSAEAGTTTTYSDDQSSGIFATYDTTIQDSSGAIIYGGSSKSKIDTFESFATEDTASFSSMSGEATYNVLQQQLAYAIARSIAFKVSPIRVTAVDEDRVRLNYGKNFLPIGSSLEIHGGGLYGVRYRVVSAIGDSAIAEVDGDLDTSEITTDSVVTFYEKGEDGENGRRYRKRRLP